MPAADDFLPEGVAPDAAGRQFADMPTAAGFQADIVERRYVDVALIVEGLIDKWRDIVGPEGKILRSVDRHGNIGDRLEPSAVSYILRQIQANITHPGNKKLRQWTGHSFRVGAAVDLVESGYTIEQVMRKGDWRSVQTGLRYLMGE